MKTLYLVDAMSQIYRAYFTPAADMRAADNEPTKATFIFMKILLKILHTKTPDYLLVCFDAKRSSLFRTELYPEYKATRGGNEGLDDLFVQVSRIKQILKVIGVPVFKVNRFEADDLIAGAVNRFKNDVECVMVSRDRDLDQLFERDRVSMFDPMTDTFRTVDDLEQQGYSAADVPLLKALTGDNGDNIIGVEGIGPKRALDLVKKYKTIDEIFASLEDLPESMQRRLEGEEARIRLNYQLVNLKQTNWSDCWGAWSLEDLRTEPIELKKAALIFKALGFTRWT